MDSRELTSERSCRHTSKATAYSTTGMHCVWHARQLFSAPEWPDDIDKPAGTSPALVLDRERAPSGHVLHIHHPPWTHLAAQPLMIAIECLAQCCVPCSPAKKTSKVAEATALAGADDHDIVSIARRSGLGSITVLRSLHLLQVCLLICTVA